MSNELLFLTSSYLPDPGANGIITDILINELMLHENKVTVLSTKTEENEPNFQIIDNKKIHRISKSKFTEKINDKNTAKTKRILIRRKIKLILNINKFPNFDLDQNEKTYKKAKEIILDNPNIENIICIYKPYSNVEAVKKLKNEFPQINCVLYCLDFFDDIKLPIFIKKNWINPFINKRIIKILEPFDYFFVSENKKEIFDNSSLKQLKHKVRVFNYPTLRVDKEDKNFNLEKTRDYMLFVYAGTLDKNYRNPEIFIKSCLSLHNDGNKIKIEIFGKNDLEKTDFYLEKKLPLKNYGYKSKNEVDVSIKKSDFLINVSNKMENTVPSKIFELFATGKPIINYVKNRNDKTLEYFNKYSLCFNFYEQENYEEQLEELKRFVSKNYRKRLDKEVIKEIFYKNTPQYNTEEIIKVLVGKKK